MGSSCISPGEGLAKGIWTVNRVTQKWGMMNAEYLYAAVKPGIVCSICKDHHLNSVAECKSICNSWSGMGMNIMDVSITELVRRFGFTLFNKPWKQLTNPFTSLRNCRELKSWLFILPAHGECSLDRIHWVLTQVDHFAQEPLKPCCWMTSDLSSATTVTVLLY